MPMDVRDRVDRWERPSAGTRHTMRSKNRRRDATKSVARPRKRAALYHDLAPWWPLISPPEDFEEEAARHAQLLKRHKGRKVRTVLELGSGGGNNAVHLKARFQMTLVDLSSGMLRVSRSINPDCEHIRGDMRSLRLGRQFDAVFAHDAIMYMTSERDLLRALTTAFLHCRPGGTALFAPDHVRETFAPATRHGGHDQGSRSARYIEWTWDPDPSDTWYVSDFGYLLRDARGRIKCEPDRHILGLFGKSDWLRLLETVGFVPRAIRTRNPTLEPSAGFVFVGTRP